MYEMQIRGVAELFTEVNFLDSMLVLCHELLGVNVTGTGANFLCFAACIHPLLASPTALF